MAKSLDAWIHNFTVTDCETHKQGFTVYKITSIVFPVFVPESLTCITVWKRYNDVKKLHKQIVQRHRELRLDIPSVPQLSDDGYFRRFDAEVIVARKLHILHFLDYIAKHPCLYKSHAFVHFFESSQSPPSTTLPPKNHHYHEESTRQQHQHPPSHRHSNIASICGAIEVPQQLIAGSYEYQLIDPHREQQQPDDDRRTGLGSSLASSSTVSSSSETTSVCSDAEAVSITSMAFVQPDISVDSVEPRCDVEDVNAVDCAIEAFDDGHYHSEHGDNVYAEPETDATIAQSSSAVSTADYIFEAALEFSDAVRAEVARNYRQSFELYKNGIGKLMHGVRLDANAERRRVAKDKIRKYLLRAEQIHACHLLNRSDNDDTAYLSLRSPMHRGRTKMAERLVAFEELSRIRVLKVMHGVMQVQDKSDQNIYIMKVIEKPANFSVQLFEHAPRVVGMVELIAFFVSETAVYLLLQQANGGRLWDYIRTYEDVSIVDGLKHETNGDDCKLNRLFAEADTPVETLSKVADTAAASDNDDDDGNDAGPLIVDPLDSDDVDDDVFLGALHRLRSPRKTSSSRHGSIDGLDAAIETLERNAPAFEMLTSAMDVSDLLDCSQKLLVSVANTLERSNNVLVNDEPKDEDTMSTSTLLANVSPIEEILRSHNASHSRPPAAYERTNSVPCDAVVKSQSSFTNGRKASPIPLRSIVRWASELCCTIGRLHANGIQCGDLSAANLLLGPDGRLLLSYFYRAGPPTEAAGTVSFEALDGLYVAPERPLTQKSDWWSFGVLLFELLTGERYVDCHPGGSAAYYDVQCPDGVALSEDALDLLRGTIQLDIDARLDEKAVREHRFFQDIDWTIVDDIEELSC